MTIKFETYNKRYNSTSIKIVIPLIILTTITWLTLFFINLNTEIDYLRYCFIIFFILSIVSSFAYKIMSLENKKFIPTGIIEFKDNCITINTENSTYLIPIEDIIKLTLFKNSYDGQAEFNYGAKGNVTLDGLENRFFIQSKEISQSYKFYINNRGQVIMLSKLLNNWKNNFNINIHFTDKNSKDCLMVIE